MSFETAIKVENLSKCYQIYEHPRDRLKQFLLPRLKRSIGWTSVQYFREFWALHDVSLQIMKGETVGIIGRNGSGKSTLLQMICGTLTPSFGRVQTNGRIAALLELGSGFSAEFTGRENIYMNCAVLGLSRDEIDNRFDQIAAFADIGTFIDQPAKTYSSGMYVRLAFSVAVNVDPDILVVDEALAVGDVRFQVKCHKVFEEFRASGKTMILVSHSSSDIVRLCTRAIWLESGKLRTDGDAKRIAEAYHAEMVHNVKTLDVDQNSYLGAEELGYNVRALAAVPDSAMITGEGGVAILSVGLLDSEGNALTILDRSRRVRIEFVVKSYVALATPFFAFQIVNSRGLRVFGSNTYVQKKILESIGPNRNVHASFEFDFPEVHNGDYLIAIGVGDGTPADHIRHAFVSDAYAFKVSSDSLYQTQDVLLKLPDCKSDLKLI